MKDKENKSEEQYIEIIQRLTKTVVILLLIIVALITLNIYDLRSTKIEKAKPNLSLTKDSSKKEMTALSETIPDTSLIRNESNADLICYGRDLIERTSEFLGPKGSVAQISNGMNCQNCHLEGGRKPYGNNYLSVAATYPKFRERSGTNEDIYKRVSDCFERSLNGTSLDTNSREMKAIKAYILWIGKDQPKGKRSKTSGIVDLAYLDRAADPEKGKTIYNVKCVSCHGKNGEGKMHPSVNSFLYPPLWGDHSYNHGAGLYRLSRFAGYIKYNMPQGANYERPQLSDEEAWDIAAFVNSQKRPAKDLSKDWPMKETKPIDHPFGPYADRFSEKQHKYGPFEAIAFEKKKQKTKS